MVKKVNDIKHSSVKKPHSFVWNRKFKPTKSVFFIASLVIIFVVVNFINVTSSGKIYFKSLLDFSHIGFNSLLNAKEQIKLTNFEDALVSFDNSEQTFTMLSQDTWFLENDLFDTKLLLDSVKLLASAGSDLSKIASNFNEFPIQLIAANAEYQASGTPSKINLSTEIATANKLLLSVNVKLDRVIANLNSNTFKVLPSQLSQQKDQALTQINQLNQIVKGLLHYLNIFSDLAGTQVSHTYLILIQNNYESRPVGGFLGSLVYAEVNNGILTNLDFKDIYDFDGVLTDNPPKLPTEYFGFNEKLWIRDANYTPDFAISASRIETLLQRAKAPSVDTIISIDQSFIEELLSITGPIRLSDYNAEINANNYFTVLTYLIEANKSTNSADKQILSDFIDQFQQKIFTISKPTVLFQLFLNNLNSKHIQLFSKKKDIQQEIEKYNYGNRFKPSLENEDLLLVTNTSVGGNKTDRYIKQRIIHNTIVNQDSTLKNKITIKKFHSFKNSDEYIWQRQLLPFGITELQDFTRYILGRGDNVSMVKIYIPNSATNLSLSNYDKSFTPKIVSDPDLKQKYVLYKSILKPQQTIETTLSFDLPFKLKTKPVHEYKLNLMNQAGTINTIFQKIYSYQSPSSPKLYGHVPSITSYDQDNFPVIEFDLQSDSTLTAIFASN